MSRRIDPMRSDDVPSVLSIERGSPESSGWDEPQLRGELERTWARLWVRREGNDVVAFIATWLVQDELHVLNVATHPLRRRLGHARALLQHALEFARQNKVRHVLLEVRRSNTGAITLYRALGFLALGVRQRYYGDDEDAVEMILRLDEAGNVVPGADEVRLDS